MRWWDNFLGLPLKERMAWGFVTFCLALTTGLLIGTALLPDSRRNQSPQSSTRPIDSPTSAGGVGGRPQDSLQPRRTTHSPSHRRPTTGATRKPSRKPSYHPTPLPHPTTHVPTTPTSPGHTTSSPTSPDPTLDVPTSPPGPPAGPLPETYRTPFSDDVSTVQIIPTLP